MSLVTRDPLLSPGDEAPEGPVYFSICCECDWDSEAHPQGEGPIACPECGNETTEDVE